MVRDKWIRQRESTEWPAGSLDLSLLDFIIKVYLKSVVYISQPQNVEKLLEIRTEIGRAIQKVVFVFAASLHNDYTIFWTITGNIFNFIELILICVQKNIFN